MVSKVEPKTNFQRIAADHINDFKGLTIEHEADAMSKGFINVTPNISQNDSFAIWSAQQNITRAIKNNLWPKQAQKEKETRNYNLDALDLAIPKTQSKSLGTSFAGLFSKQNTAAPAQPTEQPKPTNSSIPHKKK